LLKFSTRLSTLEDTMARKPPIKRRKRPSQERSRATVEAILQAATRVFVKDGYDRATTNRIAEVAGVSIGSLYQYFPNKESLIAALLERHVQDAFDLLPRELARAEGRPLRDAVRLTVDYAIAAHRQDPELHIVLMEQIPRVGALPSAAEIDRRFHAQATAYLEAEADRVRPCNKKLAGFIASQAIEALTHAACLHHPEYLADPQFASEMTELIARYLER
jgi:AcrR family transcriptional regulator